MQSLQSIFDNTLQQHPKILAIGKNYEQHVKEMGGAQPPKEPVMFTKPITCLYQPDKNGNIFPLPKHGRSIHHETELGIMIGKQGKDISVSDAMQYVGGYFLALDMTDRDLQADLKKEGFPWDISKGQDYFMPISKFIPLDVVTDPHNLTLSLSINNKVIQEDCTGNMIFKIPDIIAYISQFMTLYPGDLIITGTPHGVGPFQVVNNSYINLKDKDEVTATLVQNGSTIAQIDLKVVQPP